ncbi:MAG: Holliday junction resolvase RuvX [Gammaproteobacteria bacterium]|nr:Holliday junction resolvase RuvX [Gammaproteobacteria bacterium]
MNDGTRPDLVLAFDFGRRRIGVASGNLHTRTASPIAALVRSGDLPWPKLDAIVAEWRPDRLIVGVPEGSSGPTSIAGEAKAFAAALAKRYGLPVETVDETLTSAAAAADLAEGRRSGRIRRRTRKEHIDERAACLIAEQWMNQRA